MLCVPLWARSCCKLVTSGSPVHSCKLDLVGAVSLESGAWSSEPGVGKLCVPCGLDRVGNVLTWESPMDPRGLDPFCKLLTSESPVDPRGSDPAGKLLTSESPVDPVGSILRASC